jgi:hypothetical protein
LLTSRRRIQQEQSAPNSVTATEKKDSFGFHLLITNSQEQHTLGSHWFLTAWRANPYSKSPLVVTVIEPLAKPEPSCNFRAHMDQHHINHKLVLTRLQYDGWRCGWYCLWLMDRIIQQGNIVPKVFHQMPHQFELNVSDLILESRQPFTATVQPTSTQEALAEIQHLSAPAISVQPSVTPTGPTGAADAVSPTTDDDINGARRSNGRTSCRPGVVLRTTDHDDDGHTQRRQRTQQPPNTNTTANGNARTGNTPKQQPSHGSKVTRKQSTITESQLTGHTLAATHVHPNRSDDDAHMPQVLCAHPSWYGRTRLRQQPRQLRSDNRNQRSVRIHISRFQSSQWS